MKIDDLLNEDGRVVKGVNTTVDVDTDEIKTQAKKFGNDVTINGFPPFLRTDGKQEKQRKMMEQACIEGGHNVDDLYTQKLFDWNKY